MTSKNEKAGIAEAYWKLTDLTAEGCYYLWGPIHSALLDEILNKDPDLITQMALTGPPSGEDQIPSLRKDMLVRVLYTASQVDKQEVEKILFKIIDYDPRRRIAFTPESLKESRKLAAEAAGKAGIKNALLRLLEDKNEEVRRTAVGATFYLWQREYEAKLTIDQRVGLAVLQELGDVDYISRWLLPSRRRLVSCLELSLSILFQYYDEDEKQKAIIDTLDTLRNIWAPIIRKVFWHDQAVNEDRLKTGRIAPTIRSALLKVIVRLVVGVLKNLEEEESFSLYDVRAFDDFFRADSEVKERFRSLVPYIRHDYDDGDLSDSYPTLLSVAQSDDLLSNYLLLVILFAQIFSKPRKTAEIIRTLLGEVMNAEHGMPSIPMMNIAISGLFDGLAANEYDTEILELQERLIIDYQQHHHSTCQIRRRPGFLEMIRQRSRKEKVLEFHYSGLSSHPQYAWKLYKDRQTKSTGRPYGAVNYHGVLQPFLDNIEKKWGYDLQRIHYYIMNVAVPGHPEYRDMEAILDALDPIVEIAFQESLSTKEVDKAVIAFNKDYGLHKAALFVEEETYSEKKVRQVVVIRQELIIALARIHIYGPKLVERYMRRKKLPSDFRQRVRNRVNEEELAPAVKGRAIFFVRDEILKKPEGELCRMFVDFFEQAPECRNLAQWVSKGLVVALNALSGADLFVVD